MSETKKTETKSDGKSVQPKGVLELVFHEGKDLKDVQTLGTQDPYVRVKIAKKERKTKEHNNGGKKPQWKDEMLQFALKGADDEIEAKVTVVDLNPISDTAIGHMDVSVLELCKTQPKKKWYQITTKDGKLAGEICMSASFVPALIFTFLEAKALHDSNVIAKMDPFVKVTIGKKGEGKIKPHVDGGVHPKWSKENTIILSRPLPEKDKAKDAKETEPTFDITVIHDGSITNDTLGHVQLPWSAAQKAKGTGPQWYQLKREKNDSKDGGQLQFSIADFAI